MRRLVLYFFQVFIFQEQYGIALTTVQKLYLESGILVFTRVDKAFSLKYVVENDIYKLSMLYLVILDIHFVCMIKKLIRTLD